MMLKLKGGMITKLEKLRTMPNREIINERPCDGLNCFNLVHKTIEVVAGTYGKIRLQLCEKCMAKFCVKEIRKNMVVVGRY